MFGGTQAKRACEGGTFYPKRWGKEYPWSSAPLKDCHNSAPTVPEPTSMLILGSSLVGLATFRRKLKKYGELIAVARRCDSITRNEKKDRIVINYG
jgi:hypothetical protein